MKLKACLLAIALCCSSTAFARKPVEPPKPIDMVINAPVERVTNGIQEMFAMSGQAHLKSAMNGVLVYDMPPTQPKGKDLMIMYMVTPGNAFPFTKIQERITFNILPGESEGTTHLIVNGEQVFNSGTQYEFVRPEGIDNKDRVELVSMLKTILEPKREDAPVLAVAKPAYKYFNEDGTLKTPANP